jgi:Carboxypeptidase regulatory-like domain/TonB-dependent Receptor Plug Domain
MTDLRFPTVGNIRINRSWLAICSILFVAGLWGQTYTGVINGLVQDPSGAPVVGVTVRLTNTATQEIRSSTTAEDGRYAFSQLNPATYSLQVQKAGFRDYVGSDILLNASQTREVNINLEVGEAKQTVEVSAGSDLIDTQTATQSTTLNTTTVEQLPQQARNPLALFNTQAGAVAPRTGVSTSDQDQNQNRFSINGARDEEVLVLIDGIPDATGDWGGAIVSPSVDSVQEFQVIRNAYDARYSRTAGGVINIITKGGTQAFHGTAFEYFQSSVLNANDFFNNLNHISKVPYHRNDFGGNIGGPIWRKWKLFGFYGAEFLRQTVPGTLITTMPTQLERNGDFSQSFNTNGTLATIFNPFTTVTNGGVSTRAPFTNNQIPSSLISSVASNVLNLLPLPNQAGSGPSHVNNFAISTFTKSVFNRYDGRVDWIASDKVSLFGRFTKAPQDTAPVDVIPRIVYNTTYTHTPRWNVALGTTWSVNPTTVLTFLVGAGKFTEVNNSVGYGLTGLQLGLPASTVSQFNVATPPAFGLSGFYSPGNSTVSIAARSMVNYGIYGSKQFSAHLVQFGWYVNRYYLSLIQTNSANFNFNRFFTDGPAVVLSGNVNSGNTLASFLLGTGASGDAPLNAAPTTAQTDWNFFVQDAWKVGQRLTINAGLAYELQRARTERYNQLNWFDFNASSPLAQAAGLPNLKGGLVFVNPNDPFQWKAPHLNFAPRIGVAYKITDNLVWRGGYGIYYVPTITVGPLGNTGYSIDNTWQSTLNNGLTPYNLLNNPFPTPLATPTGNSLGLATGAGFSITTVERVRPTPYTQQFSMDIEYQVSKGLLVTAGYSGSQGRKLLYGYGGFYQGININQVPDQYLSLGNALNQQVANPFYGVITSGPLSQPTVLRSQLLRPFPQFQNIYILDQPGATSSFNAFLLSVTGRVTNSLTLIASYQRSRAVDNSSEDQGWEVGDQFRNIYNLSLEKSVSAHDVPNSFALNYVYQLPVGRGRKFGSKLHPALDALVGGWNSSAIWTIQSGLPLIFSAPVNEFNYSAWQFPNVSATVPVTVANRNIYHWFNTAAFSAPPSFTYGDAPRYIGQIRYSLGNNWNLTVGKYFSLPLENLKLQFRVEMYNAFNHVRFGRADTNFTDNGFGLVTGEAPGAGPRIIQMALRLQF